MYRNGTPFSIIPTSGIVNPFNFNGQSQCTFPGIGEGVGPKSAVRQLKFEEIVNNVKNFTNFDTTMRYLDNMYAIMEFERDSTWLTTGAPDDTLYQNYYQTMTSGNMGKVCEVTRCYANEDYTTLAQRNSAITPNCQRENHIKQVNDIFLNTWANGNYEYDATQQQYLEDLACSDALENGPAVYAARTLVGFFGTCSNGFTKSMNITMIETDIITAPQISYTLYPNPSENEVYLSYVLEEDMTSIEIVVYDIMGKVITQRVLTNREDNLLINDRQLESGVYLYTFTNQGTVIGTGKFIIK